MINLKNVTMVQLRGDHVLVFFDGNSIPTGKKFETEKEAYDYYLDLAQVGGFYQFKKEKISIYDKKQAHVYKKGI